MVGIGTVRQDNPRLTARISGKKTRNPLRIILDSALSISEDREVLKSDSGAETLIICAESASESQKQRFTDQGIKILTAPLKDGGVDLNWLMERLGQMQITSLLIEGGSRVIASALNAGIADKVLFFYAPKILGGDDGFPICRGSGPELMNQSIPVRNISIQRFGEDILVEGYPGQNRE
jgi:diaminohydroxyphosphoribosylaminopyrimidine deaminase/5-amino-6-(5-phosphoribosylamino)uracil reductase